jgi:hypothetical protein
MIMDGIKLQLKLATPITMNQAPRYRPFIFPFFATTTKNNETSFETRWRSSKQPEIEGEPPERIIAQAEIALPPQLRCGELSATGKPAVASPHTHTSHIIRSLHVRKERRIIELLCN